MEGRQVSAKGFAVIGAGRAAIGAGRALLAHGLVLVCLFGPVVVLGGAAGVALGVRAELAALFGLGVYFTWIGARAGQLQVWAEEPRR